MPNVYRELLQVSEALEEHFCDVCDIEFTIENGRLFILNVCTAKRTPRANLRFALQFFAEGRIGINDVLTRVRPSDLEDFVKPEIRNRASLISLGRGLPACSGAATGEIVFDASEAVRLTRQSHKVIFAREEMNSEDVEAIRMSQGVLTARGGMTSHAALVCRGFDKPAVTGFGSMKIRQGMLLITHAGHRILSKGDWLTIDGVTGEVYAGEGHVAIRGWRDWPELVALASIVEQATASADISSELIGRAWKMRDFFAHGISLRRPTTSKRAVSGRRYVSFAQASPRTLQGVRSSLMPIHAGDHENYSQMLLSLADSQSRLLSSALGLGEHHRYFRPLWDPKRCVLRQGDTPRTQLIGFEYFGINRHIPHLVDISTLTFFIEVELRGESDEWFLDFTNPRGESLVASSDTILGYCLLLNDARVSYKDFPVLYHSLRRREYHWRFYEANHTSHQEIVNFLSTWPNRRLASSSLRSLCEQLGLLRDVRLTASGESLLGKSRRKHKYELAGFEQ